MNDTILLGQGTEILAVPRTEWEKHLAEVPQHMQARLSFMSEAHHAVRYFTVRELARHGAPLTPDFIAGELDLPLDRTQALLDDLEQHLFFLARDEMGAVAWAYPVTVDATPHRLTFSTGERLNAA
jgi:hypothetical protein